MKACALVACQFDTSLSMKLLVNGQPIRTASHRSTLFWQPDGPGFVRLTVMDASGAADTVVVRVQ